MDDRDRKELVRQAFLAQQQAYAPYSEFLVGACRKKNAGNGFGHRAAH